jgi:hypothetical protein
VVEVIRVRRVGKRFPVQVENGEVIHLEVPNLKSAYSALKCLKCLKLEKTKTAGRKGKLRG